MTEGVSPMGKKGRPKRADQKPMLRKIKLNAGEILASGCKTTVGAGPAFIPCIAGCNLAGS